MQIKKRKEMGMLKGAEKIPSSGPLKGAEKIKSIGPLEGADKVKPPAGLFKGTDKLPPSAPLEGANRVPSGDISAKVSLASLKKGGSKPVEIPEAKEVEQTMAPSGSDAYKERIAKRLKK